MKTRFLKKKIRPYFEKGFTILELLTAVAVIGILMSVVIFSTIGSKEKSRDAHRASELSQIETIIEQWRAVKGYIPDASGKRASSPDPDNIIVDCNTTRKIVDPGGGKCLAMKSSQPHFIGSTSTDFNIAGAVNEPVTDPKYPDYPNCFYLYVTDGIDYEVMSVMEKKGDLMVNDQGNSCRAYEKGSNVNLAGGWSSFGTSQISQPVCGGSLEYKVMGSEWTDTSSNFVGRSRHASVVFKNKMWVIGGLSGGLYKSDVYSSSDGVSWNHESNYPAAPPNDYKIADHAVVVYNNEIWVIGGYVYGIGKTNEVYHSVDGINWVSGPPLTYAISKHSAVVVNNKIYVIGGEVGSVPTRAIYEYDGSSWTRYSDKLNCGIIYHTSLVDGNNRIWVMGGYSSGINCSNGQTDDIWYSDDFGQTWIGGGANGYKLPYEVQNHSSVFFDNKIWLIGGQSSDYAYCPSGRCNSVWYSVSGKANEWNLAGNLASGNYYMTSLVYQDKVFTVGGQSSSEKVYYSESCPIL